MCSTEGIPFSSGPGGCQEQQVEQQSWQDRLKAEAIR